MKIMLISNHIKEDFDKQVKAKNDVRLMRVDNFYFFENKIVRNFLSSFRLERNIKIEFHMK